MKELNQSKKKEDKKLVLSDDQSIKLFTRSELAKVLKIGISSVDMIPVEELPRVRFGKSVRFTLKSISEYIQKKETADENKLRH